MFVAPDGRKVTAAAEKAAIEETVDALGQGAQVAGVADPAEPRHPQIRAAFAPDTPLRGRYDHPVCAQEFLDGLWKIGGAGHQVGGHPYSVQDPVEIEVAQAVLDGQVSLDDPRLSDEAGGWSLLAQFDSEACADMMWGDAGALYWLIRPRDLAERRFDRAMFTWQCS
ncbi:DUF1963 domain-containing protein [Streptomyces sp. NPDC048256]|uniref:DUF1963 domain-containing protein n=1 Tax=Streptomyces sp. NPDC048256 TaxID=3154613 RepID=UPI0033D6D65E